MSNGQHDLSGSEGSDRARLLDSVQVELLAVILAGTTALSAIYLYFGWIRTTALFDFFGVDGTLLDFGPTEYILRSVEVLFRPTLVIVLIILAGSAVRAVIAKRASPSSLRRVNYATGAVVILLILIMLAVFTGTVDPLAAATILGFAGILVSFSWYSKSVRVAGVAILLLAAFWFLTVYANRSGTDLARQIAADPSVRPSVVVYSKSPLNLPNEETTGFGTVPPTAESQVYLYRYDGLNLLTFSESRWILIRTNWTADSRVSILNDDGSIRVDLDAGSDEFP